MQPVDGYFLLSKNMVKYKISILNEKRGASFEKSTFLVVSSDVD